MPDPIPEETEDIPVLPPLPEEPRYVPGLTLELSIDKTKLDLDV